MGRRTILAALAVASLCVAAAAQAESYVVSVRRADPPKGFQKLRISKAVVGGSEIRVWANAAINPDCTAIEPGPALRILSGPEHGIARLSDDPLYLAFPPANPRSSCNQQKIPAHAAYYVANAGYTGHDKVVLQGSSPEGRVREITVDIDVR